MMYQEFMKRHLERMSTIRDCMERINEREDEFLRKEELIHKQMLEIERLLRELESGE